MPGRADDLLPDPERTAGLTSVPLSCGTCRNLASCPYLAEDGEPLDYERLIRLSAPRACDRWQTINWRSYHMRLRLQTLAGDSWPSVIHMLPVHQLETVEDDREEGASEVNTQSLLALVRPGETTAEEREQQLRFETDEHGSLRIDEAGRSVPRLSFVLRRYALDPAGPVRADPTVTIFWTPDQLIRQIIAAEVGAGVVKRSDRKPKQDEEGDSQMGVRLKATPTTAAQAPATEETKDEQRVVSRGAPSSDAVPTKAKVARPAARVAQEQAPVAENSVPASDAQAAVQPLIDALNVLTEHVVKLSREVGELKTKMSALAEQQRADHSTLDLVAKNVDQLPLKLDVAAELAILCSTKTPDEQAELSLFQPGNPRTLLDFYTPDEGAEDRRQGPSSDR